MPVLTKTIPSYLYTQYADDDNLQGFITAYNQLSQEYVDWFNSVDLPIYTGLAGGLLDWVALGLYGMQRTPLPSGQSENKGPLNTYTLNELQPNQYIFVGPTNFYYTNDDYFKRIITWNFYKGDGKVFDIRWLKRRVMRFLYGVDGTSFNVDQTYRVSVTFGVGDQINIRIINGLLSNFVGAMPNAYLPNETLINSLSWDFEPYEQIPAAPILKAALDAGVLELPFQFTYVIKI